MNISRTCILASSARMGHRSVPDVVTTLTDSVGRKGRQGTFQWTNRTYGGWHSTQVLSTGSISMVTDPDRKGHRHEVCR